jgi:hypothetical protein
MGVKLIAVLLAAASPVSFLAGRQQPDGGFAEPGGRSNAALTAWVVLGLAAEGKPPAGAAAYLAAQPVGDATDLALRILALEALGRPTASLADRLEGLRAPSGRIGPLVDSTIWGVLALRAAGRPVSKVSVRYLLQEQRPSGGWAWYPKGAPDSNDTAAAVEALRAAGVAGKPIARGLTYLRRLEGSDGGFALVRGRASDSQSTAWAIQAFLAARKHPPAGAYRFLARMRNGDGSYRYSARYSVTPVWVTSQVLPALVRKAFPLPARSPT